MWGAWDGLLIFIPFSFLSRHRGQYWQTAAQFQSQTCQRERERKKKQCSSSLDKFEWSKSAWIYKIILKMWTRFQEYSDNATKVRKYTEILMEKFWEVNGKFQIIWGHGGDYILLKVFALKKNACWWYSKRMSWLEFWSDSKHCFICMLGTHNPRQVLPIPLVAAMF